MIRVKLNVRYEGEWYEGIPGEPATADETAKELVETLPNLESLKFRLKSTSMLKKYVVLCKEALQRAVIIVEEVEK